MNEGKQAKVLLGVAAVIAATLLAAIGPTSCGTSTGHMTFATYIYRFETLVELKDLPGALPYSVLSAGDVAWRSQGELLKGVADCKGYRFANGDVVVLFDTAVPAGDGKLLEAQEQALFELARARYPDEAVWGDPALGYVVAAHDEDYMRHLMSLAQQARTGPPELVPW